MRYPKLSPPQAWQRQGLTLSDAAALSLDLRECRDHLCMVLGSFASATRMARHCRRGPL